ncbi:phage major capsid protein [Nocardia farcinica]|uniref:phage major capsid protein n=1 Tax=Nocardia farcinica TaxID=37329 RepID=UPI0018950D59|nr:phage major capsid protein [Nocardia farcinica]MBF6233954.1 phage major capsid protein [Nocardia farcinica]
MAMTTPTSAEAWRPNVISTFDPDDMLKEALIVTASSRAGSVEGDAPSVLVPYVSTDPTAGFVPEGDLIPLADPGASQIAITTDKVAVVTRVSRELTTEPGAAERIANSLRRSVTRKADVAFMANVSDPTGLLAVAGVATAGDLGGATDPNLFAVYDAVAAIEDDGGEATHVLINPLDWAELCKLPEATGSNKSLLADVHNAAARSLGGVPVIVHSAVTEGTALVIDKTEIVSAYGQLQLARSDDAFFQHDAVAIRATWRIGWNVVRPARLQKLTIGAA